MRRQNDRSNRNSECTCGCTCQRPSNLQERHVTFEENESTIDSSNDSLTYDASGENSSFMMKQKPQNLSYDATFEDSGSFSDESFTLSLINDFNDFSYPSQSFNNQSPMRNVTRSPTPPRVGNVRRNLFQGQSTSIGNQSYRNGNASINASEKSRRKNVLHEMLGDESCESENPIYLTAEESLLEIENNPANVPLLGYAYRVNSFR